MVLSAGDHQAYLPNVEISPGRPVHDQAEQEMPSVLLAALAQPGLTLRCLPAPMDRAPVLCISRSPSGLQNQTGKARVILIGPAWPCQHWFGTLLDLSIATPLLLLLRLDLISQDHSWLLYPNFDSLHLTAWMLHVELRGAGLFRTTLTGLAR